MRRLAPKRRAKRRSEDFADMLFLTGVGGVTIRNSFPRDRAAPITDNEPRPVPPLIPHALHTSPQLGTAMSIPNRSRSERDETKAAYPCFLFTRRDPPPETVACAA